MHILVYSIEKQQYGLELNKIDSVILAVEITPLPNAPEEFLGAINVHGQITPVINMRKLLGIPTKELDINDQFILCNIHSKPIALWIDTVTHVRHYKEKSLTSPEQSLPHLHAIQHILKEDGRMILIYDLEKLIPSNATSFTCNKI